MLSTWHAVLKLLAQWALLSSWYFWRLCCIFRYLSMVIEGAVFGHLLGKLMARVWTSVKFSTCHALGCMEKVHGMSYHLGKYKGEHNPKHFFSWLLLLVMQRAKSKILMRTIEFPLFPSSRKCRKLVQSMSLAILDKEFQVTNIMSVTLVTAGGNTMWI